MEVVIKKGRLNGKLAAITSKSSMHRLLIAAALAKTETEIFFSDSNEDIEATISVLQAIGTKFVRGDNSIRVLPMEKAPINPLLYCNQSASTARFMIPVAAAVSEKSIVSGDEQLAKRPFAPLIDELRNHGVTIEGDKLPIEISGSLKSGKYSLPGNISSQFISGLLFALPLLASDSEIVITTAIESVPYIKMTIDAISQFGILVIETDGGFKVLGGQVYSSPGKIIADSDWSNSAFWLVAAAFGNDITISNLNMNSLQGDKNIIDLLNKFGAKAKISTDGISFESKIAAPQVIDAKNVPDLVPILAVAASAADGKTVIENVERLRIKESDRISSVINMINDLGGDAYFDKDAINIQGSGRLRGGTVNAKGDHRIAMAAAIAACICDDDVTIIGAEAINKSYPNFFEDYKYLGGELYVK